MSHRSTAARTCLSLAVGLVLLFSCSIRAQAADRPNIILLMGDDHGWDETGYNGHPHLKTPVLDEMAAAGLRLDHFYSAHPSCSPTRGSVMTGRHPVRYGTFAPNWSIRPEEITLAHLLSSAGYRCGHFGKWHLGPVKRNSPTSPGAMGFETWLSHDNFFELDPLFSRNGGPPVLYQGESSEILITETIDFLAEAHEQHKPFFTVVWFGSPHEPYSGLDSDLAQYKHLRDQYPGKTVRLTSNATGRPTERPLGEVLQERYAEITAMDRAIGRLREWLRSQQLDQNTLVWYCGDNGTPAGGIETSPYRGVKGTMYQGGIRVPGLIEWPAGIPRPVRSSVNAVTSDILPTVCELTGVAPPDRPLDGISLSGIWNGSLQTRQQPIFFWSYSNTEYDRQQPPYIPVELQSGTTPLVKMMAGRYTRNFTNFHHPAISAADFAGERVVLDGNHKLIVNGKGVVELFDLAADPAEQKNLADQNPDRVAAMRAALQTWQRSTLNSLTGADYAASQPKQTSD